MFDNSEGEFMLNISESEKLEYLEKLESQSVSLSEDILMILYENSDECIRSELAQTLSLYHNELSEKILVYLLNDKDELVRVNACDSLYWSHSKNTLEKLLKIMQNDKYLVRGYALLSVADIIINNNYNDFIYKVKHILKHEKSKFVLMNYDSFLYRLGDDSYLYKISENLNAKKYNVRCHAANLLYNCARKENYLTVINLFDKRLDIENNYAVKSTLQRIINDLKSEF